MAVTTAEDQEVPNLKLGDITDGVNERNIPLAKFIDEDIDAFAASFDPPASSELLIGAFTDLHNKYKSVEASLTSRRKYEFLIILCTRLLLHTNNSFEHVQKNSYKLKSQNWRLR